VEDAYHDKVLAELASAVAQALLFQGKTMAAAESCTGGWVAKLCTDLAGSSSWFERGWVTYGNAAKTDLLGVSPGILAQHGAVSEQVAAQMASGGLHAAPVDCVVSITGIAGPSGGSPDKPVGTVCFGWAFDHGLVETERHWFEGGRDQVRRASVYQALTGLLDRLDRPLRF